MADLSLRELERAHAAGRAGAAVPLASAYLRQGRVSQALATLGSPPPMAAEALEVAAGAWRKLLSRLEPVARIPSVGGVAQLLSPWGERLLVGVGLPPHSSPPLAWEARAVLVIDGAGNHESLGGETVLLAHPKWGRLALAPAALAYPMWQASWVGGSQSAEEAAPQRGPLLSGVANPDADEALVDGSLVSLPGLDEIRELFPGSAPFDVHWPSRQVAWRAGGEVWLANLDEGVPRMLEPAREYARRLPAAAASLGHLVGFESMRFLRDGRLCLAPPLALVSPGGERYEFPNRGDPRGLSGAPVLSLDGGSLLMNQAGRVAAFPLERGAQVAALRGDLRRWHPVADCLLRAEGAASPARLGGVREQVWFSFPHGLSAICWTPDGRGVLLQRRLGAEPGPLELWRTAEGDATLRTEDA